MLIKIFSSVILNPMSKICVALFLGDPANQEKYFLIVYLNSVNALRDILQIKSYLVMIYGLFYHI